MADSKITALDNLTSADPANDMIPIVDVSATPPASGNTKRISINNILACSPTATLASATITGDLTVDTSTLKVDSANNRVGVLTAAPARTLDVNGVIRGNSDFEIATSGGVTQGYIFGSGTSLFYRTVSGSDHVWQNVGTEWMRLNSTGLGVGVTPSAWQNTVKALQVGTQSAAWQYSSTLFLTNNRYFDGANKYIGNGYSLSYHQNPSTGTHEWYYSTNNSSGAGAALSPVEGMRLDASGNLLVGKTTSLFSTVGVEASQAGFLGLTNSASANTTTNLSLYSTGAAAFRFYVGLGGTVYATNTTISPITSDERLKQNIVDYDKGLEEVLALRPRHFEYKAEPNRKLAGFISQEVKTVIPDAIRPTLQDPEMMTYEIDWYPLLVKAIQELTARVQTLEAR